MKRAFHLVPLLLLTCACACSDSQPVDQLRQRGMEFVFDEDGSVQAAYLYSNEAESPIVDDDVARLTEFPSLELLLIESRHVTDAALEHVKKLPNLEELDLTFCSGREGPEGEIEGGITDAGLQHLAEMTRLKSVGLEFTRVTDEGADWLRTALPDCEIRFRFRDPLLDALARHDGDLNAAIKEVATETAFNDKDQLVRLKLIATDAALKHVAKFDTLHELWLRGDITNKSLDWIAKLTDLTLLDLAAGQGEAERLIDDEGLRSLAPLQRLESLNLSRSRITDAGLKHLRQLKGLKKLTVFGCAVTREALMSLKQALPDCQIVFSGAPIIDGLINSRNDLLAAVKAAAEKTEENQQGELIAVEFRLSPVTDSDLEKLAELESLRRLSFLFCRRITDEGMQHLRQLEGLESLTLSYTNISSEGLSHLSGLPRLKKLDLSASTQIDAFGLEYLADLESLEELNLWGAPDISDEAIDDLARLRKLKRLDLRKTALTAEGISKLRTRLPNCEILF